VIVLVYMLGLICDVVKCYSWNPNRLHAVPLRQTINAIIYNIDSTQFAVPCLVKQQTIFVYPSLSNPEQGSDKGQFEELHTVMVPHPHRYIHDRRMSYAFN